MHFWGFVGMIQSARIAWQSNIANWSRSLSACLSFVDVWRLFTVVLLAQGCWNDLWWNCTAPHPLNPTERQKLRMFIGSFRHALLCSCSVQQSVCHWSQCKSNTPCPNDSGSTLHTKCWDAWPRCNDSDWHLFSFTHLLHKDVQCGAAASNEEPRWQHPWWKTHQLKHFCSNQWCVGAAFDLSRIHFIKILSVCVNDVPDWLNEQSMGATMSGLGFDGGAEGFGFLAQGLGWLVVHGCVEFEWMINETEGLLRVEDYGCQLHCMMNCCIQSIVALMNS